MLKNYTWYDLVTTSGGPENFPIFLTVSRDYGCPHERHRVHASPPQTGMETSCCYSLEGKLDMKIERRNGSTNYLRYNFDGKGHLDAVNLNDAPEERYCYEWFGKRVESWTKTHGYKRYYYNDQDQLVEVKARGGKKFNKRLAQGPVARNAKTNRVLLSGLPDPEPLPARADEYYSSDARITEYEYSLDGSLRSKQTETGLSRFSYEQGRLKYAHLEDGKRLSYEYEPQSANPQGPVRKYIHDILVAEYEWFDLVHLQACIDYRQGLFFEFEYDEKGTLKYITITTLPPDMCLQAYAKERVSREMLAGYSTSNISADENSLYSVKCACGVDQVGSPRVLKADGTLIKIIDYDSFGNIKDERGVGFHLPIGFAGGLHDCDTGLVRFGFRDYDPEVGRFTSLDPLGDTGGDHDLYDYCVDDPVSIKDETGLLGQKSMGVPVSNTTLTDQLKNTYTWKAAQESKEKFESLKHSFAGLTDNGKPMPDVFGAYRGAEIGIYQNDPIIFTHEPGQENAAAVKIAHFLIPNSGVFGAVASQSYNSGNTKLTVYGNPSTGVPSSWNVAYWSKTGKKLNPELDTEEYGWQILQNPYSAMSTKAFKEGFALFLGNKNQNK